MSVPLHLLPMTTRLPKTEHVSEIPRLATASEAWNLVEIAKQWTEVRYRRLLPWKGLLCDNVISLGVTEDGL